MRSVTVSLPDREITVNLPEGIFRRAEKVAEAQNKFLKTIGEKPYDVHTAEDVAKKLIQEGFGKVPAIMKQKSVSPVTLEDALITILADGLKKKEKIFEHELGLDEYRWRPVGKEEKDEYRIPIRFGTG